MAREYNRSLQLCKDRMDQVNDGDEDWDEVDEERREMHEERLRVLEKKHYELVEELGVRWVGNRYWLCIL